MGAGAAAAAAVLTLSGGALGQPSYLHRAGPATLQPEGAALRLPSSAFGFAWARRGATIAVVAKPNGGFGFAIRIVDAARLRLAGTIVVGKRDVCGLTFRGATLVALTANQVCYWPGGTFSVLRIDVRRRRIISTRPVRDLRTVDPTNLAFGDNQAFITLAGGGIDAVNLTTSVLTAHRPRRSLAKGEGIVWAHWLGDHLLGAGPRVVDVRTWRSRVLERGARGVISAGADLVAYGERGVAVYTRGGRFLFRPETQPAFAGVASNGRYLYVGSEVVDLRTRHVRPVGAEGLLYVLAP